MKIVVKPKTKNEPLGFPKLMIDNDDGIVFFHRHGYGMVISEKCGGFRNGELSTHWNMAAFKDFHGTVTLSN